jgi:hypothetical protein
LIQNGCGEKLQLESLRARLLDDLKNFSQELTSDFVNWFKDSAARPSKDFEKESRQCN